MFKKYKKVFITFTDLAKVIQKVLHNIIHHLDSKRLLNQSITQFRGIRKTIQDEHKTIETRLNEIMENLILNMNDYSKDWKENREYMKMSQLKKEKSILLEELSEKEQLLEENKTIIEAVESYLNDCA